MTAEAFVLVEVTEGITPELPDDIAGSAAGQRTADAASWTFAITRKIFVGPNNISSG